MEYSWHLEDGAENNSRASRVQSRNQGPGLIEELDFEAYMGPVGEGCYAPHSLDNRRTGGHQLPESPPDSGSENPYSPPEAQMSISVPQTVLGSDYMLVHDHLPSHEMLAQNGDYIYEELKSDEVLRGNLNDVVVLPQDPNIVELGIRSVRHDLDLDMYQNRYPPLGIDQGMISPQLVALGHESLTPVYTSLQEPNPKRRKHEDSHNVKCEPALSPEAPLPRPAPPSAEGSEAGDDAPLQCIRFQAFQQHVWHALFDAHLKPLQPPSYVVGADKGFNYSQIDEAFVCQKKNHFQVTCQIQMQGDPQYLKTSEGFKKISNFCLHFYGVKAEDPSQEVRVEQSQSDRTKKPFHPVPVELRREGTKITVGRLHFAETTNNNMRKKGRPNPDQRHFQLVVALKAHTAHADYIVAAHASDRIIVRASNPGQFESDCPEGWWQRGVADNSVHFSGRVGINTDRPDEACVVNGNLKVMGQILHPSDARAKHNIEELDTAQQLKNVQSIRVVKFNYDPSFAEHSGLVGYDPLGPRPALDTGVIAQEVRTVLPEAVREAGDVALPNGDTIHKFLVVNKDRIFMENLGAVKELCKVTGLLESRIEQLEQASTKPARGLQRAASKRSTNSNDSHYSASSTSSKSLYSDNVSIDQIRDIARNIRKHECCHKLSHHSPKYTRKQCKNCHTYSKYGKYYNYNKTCVRYHSKDKLKDNSNPAYIDTESPSTKTEDTIKKKDTCLWVRSEDDFSYGNNKMGLVGCCRRKEYSDASSELISNKFLQVVITILIFIMAVCLVVMSALYFREHQELITMKEIRMHEKFSNYPHYGQIKGVPVHRTPPDQNQIQTSKSSQHAAAKKPTKEKGPHKTTIEYATSTSSEPPPHASSTTLPNKSYVSNLVINTVQTTPPPPPPDRSISLARIAEVIGNGCNFALNTNNELDPECQSSCGLDPPQTYENQEPLERRKSDKELNDTFARPIEPIQKDKLPIIPVIIPEKNNSESLQKENESFKINEDIINESNYLDGSKQNGTDNVSRRLKREVRYRRETDEMSSDEMGLDQSRELAAVSVCDTVRFGIAHKSGSNTSLFVDTVCSNAAYNLTYTVPLSHCLTHKNIDITFKTSKLKDFRLCDLHCAHDDPAKNCHKTEISKAIPSGDLYTFTMSLDCNIDRTMKVRALFPTEKLNFSTRDRLCDVVPEPHSTFVQYNIRIYRHCQN